MNTCIALIIEVETLLMVVVQTLLKLVLVLMMIMLLDVYAAPATEPTAATTN
jgi:hypothetical protein